MENPCTLLVGIYIGGVTIENSMEILQKKKKTIIELQYDTTVPILGMHPKEIRQEIPELPQPALFTMRR